MLSSLILLPSAAPVAASIVRIFGHAPVIVLDMERSEREDVLTSVIGAFPGAPNMLRFEDEQVVGTSEAGSSDDPILHFLEMGSNDPDFAVDIVRRFSLGLLGDDRLLVLMDTDSIRKGPTGKSFGNVTDVVTIAIV